MSMQDRVYAVAIFIIFGICCIGAYVAISGFLNANPDGISISLNSETATPTAGVTVAIPTETAGPPTGTPLPPTRTPVGFRPSDTPAATRPPTLDFIPTLPTQEATATPPPSETATPVGCGSSFCPRLGPPDARGPKGSTCSVEYIWGFVVNANGQGVPNIRLHFREVNGAEGDTRSKGDAEAGKFDFPATTGTWTIAVWSREGDPVSPAIQIQAGQAWGGSGNCPTRIDFVQQ